MLVETLKGNFTTTDESIEKVPLVKRKKKKKKSEKKNKGEGPVSASDGIQVVVALNSKEGKAQNKLTPVVEREFGKQPLKHRKNSKLLPQKKGRTVGIKMSAMGVDPGNLVSWSKAVLTLVSLVRRARPDKTLQNVNMSDN